MIGDDGVMIMMTACLTRGPPRPQHSAELLEVISPPHPRGIVSVQIGNPAPVSLTGGSAAIHQIGAEQQWVWSNADVLFHYISREQLERQVLVRLAATQCARELIGDTNAGATTEGTCGRRGLS